MAVREVKIAVSVGEGATLEDAINAVVDWFLDYDAETVAQFAEWADEDPAFRVFEDSS